MIDMHREAYREEVLEVFSVHESSKRSIINIIDEACWSENGRECLQRGVA